MFAEIELDEPIEKVLKDWDYLVDRVCSKFTGFRGAGQNILGLRRRLIPAEGVMDPQKGVLGGPIELGPNGVVVNEFKAGQLHLTTAGTPHRVQHNFGYWHINDKDEVYLPLPPKQGDELGHLVLLIGTPRAEEKESFAWYCEECTTLLYDFVVETGSGGLASFWRGETEAVHRYNSDVKLRTCPECTHVNPHGYRWNKAKHTPDEAAACLLW